MNPGEATRQYQVALEHERRARAQWDGVVSAADELDDAIRDRQACQAVMERAVLEHQLQKEM